MMMFKSLLIFAGVASLQLATATYSGSATFQSGSTAVYSPGATVSNGAGCTVNYPAGSTVQYPSNTYVTYPSATTIYGQNGPVTYQAGTTVQFPAGSQVSYGPGASCYYPQAASTTYKSFNGNTGCIVNYPATTNVNYANCQTTPSYYPAGTNPVNYYNPGGSTSYGNSGPQVNSVSYVKNNDGSQSSVTCSGYSYQGWPTTTIKNQYTGSVSYCKQVGPSSYQVTNSYGQTSTTNASPYSG